MQFVDERSSCLFEVGHVVMMDEFGAAAVDAATVALADDQFLAVGGVTVTA